MAKVNNLKRINSGDFDKDDQALVDKLGFAINPLLEQVTNAFNKGIDFDNLNQELVTVQTEVDASFIPKVLLEIRTSLRTRVKGAIIIAANNLSDSASLSGAPFLDYDLATNGVTVKRVFGLAPNKKYSITVIFIG